MIDEQLFSLVLFRRFKKLLWREMNEMRQVRQNLDYLYFVEYIARFFRMIVNHIAISTNRSFDFILTNRRDNEIELDFVHYLFKFMRCKNNYQISHDALITFIASNIMLNAYLLKMHNKTILISMKTTIFDQNSQSSIQRCFMTFNIDIFVFNLLLRHIMIAISFNNKTSSFVVN